MAIRIEIKDSYFLITDTAPGGKFFDPPTNCVDIDKITEDGTEFAFTDKRTGVRFFNRVIYFSEIVNSDDLPFASADALTNFVYSNTATLVTRQAEGTEVVVATKEFKEIHVALPATNEEGEVVIADYNCVLIAVRNKLASTITVPFLSFSAYLADKGFVRLWKTTDFSAITDGTQLWADASPSTNIEKVVFDPDAGTPIAFDTTKATPIYNNRLEKEADFDKEVSKLELAPGDMLVITLHKAGGGATEAGASCNLKEEII